MAHNVLIDNEVRQVIPAYYAANKGAGLGNKGVYEVIGAPEKNIWMQFPHENDALLWICGCDQRQLGPVGAVELAKRLGGKVIRNSEDIPR